MDFVSQANAARREYELKYDILENKKQQYINLLENQIEISCNLAKKQILSIRGITASAGGLYNKKTTRSNKKYLFSQERKELEISQQCSKFINNLRKRFSFEIQSIATKQQSMANELNRILLCLNRKNRRSHSDSGEESDSGSDSSSNCDSSDSDCDCDLKEGELGHCYKEECYVWQLNCVADKLLTSVNNRKLDNNNNNNNNNNSRELFSEYTKLKEKLASVEKVLLEEQKEVQLQGMGQTKVAKEITVNDRRCSEESNANETTIDDNDSCVTTTTTTTTRRGTSVDNEKLAKLMKEEITIALLNARDESLLSGIKLTFALKSKIKREIKAKYKDFKINNDTHSDTPIGTIEDNCGIMIGCS